jgi:hypothetical protein
MSAMMRTMRKASMRDIRRAAPDRSLAREGGLTPTLVNGGGTGSVDETTNTGVTEVAADRALQIPPLITHSSPRVADLSLSVPP